MIEQWRQYQKNQNETEQSNIKAVTHVSGTRSEEVKPVQDIRDLSPSY
jgi:hypothetical protein